MSLAPAMFRAPSLTRGKAASKLFTAGDEEGELGGGSCGAVRKSWDV